MPTVDLTGDDVDIIVSVGTALDVIIDYKINGEPIDVTGWSVRSDWKVKPSDEEALVAVDGEVYDGEAGEFRYYMSDENLSDLISQYAEDNDDKVLQSVYYDFFVRPLTGDWISLVKGKVIFKRSITSTS